LLDRANGRQKENQEEGEKTAHKKATPTTAKKRSQKMTKKRHVPKGAEHRESCG
jgi:hypothetical protein